ncbi:MarR family winged helix-turn-helix transcriptional regulator [Deinococcus radiophilus]|nr:MarR family winged helix-turn-helix transcriptional regulator [Deinococcus radiophilus]UFA51293.1 MarR family winged helix-turn-helix transcriptional regulator [Deinococcus radiophilus]
MNTLSPPMLFLMGLWDVWQSLTREGEQLLREHGLDLRSFIVLCYVGAGTAQPTALASALGVARYDISRTLKRLEEAGLLERFSDPGDARRSHLTLSSAGVTCQAKAEAALLGLVQSRLDRLQDTPGMPDSRSLGQALMFVAGSDTRASPDAALPPSLLHSH